VHTLYMYTWAPDGAVIGLPRMVFGQDGSTSGELIIFFVNVGVGEEDPVERNERKWN